MEIFQTEGIAEVQVPSLLLVLGRIGVLPTPDKHDGVVNVTSTRWAANHSNEDFWNQHNPDEDEIAPGKDQGGYNHFEIRNAKRNYTLPGVFNKGDVNPPMKKVADWITANSENF